MTEDGRLGRNHLLGGLGDAVNAILCGVGYNLRLLCNWLRYLFVLFAPQRQRRTAVITAR